MTDSPSALPGSPPRRQWSALFVFARKYAQPSCMTWPGAEVGCEGLHDAAGPERQLQRGSDRRHLVGRGLDHLLLAAGPVEVGLRGVEPVLPDPRVDERPLPVHVLAALAEPPAVPRPAARPVAVRAVERVGEDRPGHVDVDATDRVDQVPEAVEVDERDVIDVEPGQVLDRPQRERRAAELERRVDLGRSVAGDLDPQVARDREEREPVLPGIGADQHDRVGAARVAAPGLGAAVGAEHEDRRRRRGEQPVLARQLARHRRGHAGVGIGDAARDRHVARDEPDDTEEEHDGERDRDAPPHASLSALPGACLRPRNPCGGWPADAAAGPCPLPDHPCRPDRASLVRAFGRLS